MARTDPQVNFRIPEELNERLKEAAAENNRTLTAELVSRLERSFRSKPDQALDLRMRIGAHRELAISTVELLGSAIHVLRQDKKAGKTVEVSARDGTKRPLDEVIRNTARALQYFEGQRDRCTELLTEIAMGEVTGDRLKGPEIIGRLKALGIDLDYTD